MIEKTVSDKWELVLSRILTELIPIQSEREHFAADECWCIPNRMKIQHIENDTMILNVWVHAGDTVEDSQDLPLAIDGVVEYWDNITK